MMQTIRKTDQAATSEQVIWDDAIQGLGQRIREGRETWIVQTRIKGKTRKRTLGAVADIPLHQARELAEHILHELRTLPPPEDTDPDLKNFAARFLQNCAGQWKPSTLDHNRYAIERKILPHFAGQKLRSVSRADVIAWHQSYEGSAASANRHLAVLSSLMRHAELVGLRPPGTNPAQGLRRRQSDFKANYLDDAGWQKLGDALRRSATKYPTQAAYIRFLCLTGCRRSEALALSWPMINGSCAVLPDSKTGPRAIWLGKPTKKLLSALPQYCERVFARPTGPLSEGQVNYFWKQLTQHSDLPGLRIHDLRHSFASLAAHHGIGLRSIGGLLGHTDIGSTAGYAHLNETAERKAGTRVANKLDKIMEKPVLKGDQRFERFVRSKQSMIAFCETWEFDIEAFRSELRAWRNRTGGASR